MVDFNVLPSFAGWDLENQTVVNYQSLNCDFFLEYVGGDDVFYLNVGNVLTDLQDMGYTSDFDEISFSPDSGWSLNGWAEVILGHTYIFWTDDNHFAKIRITSIDRFNDRIFFDWAYQIAQGNRELKPIPKRRVDYLRHP
jgi:hypothetical protein